MKKYTKILSLIAVAAICIVTQTGCAGKEPVSGADFLLNTSCSITIYDSTLSTKEQEELISRVFALCREYEGQMSRTVADGDVGRINSSGGAPVTVEADTAEVIEAGLKYGGLSKGLFDITVGQIAELWNFSGDNPKVPPAAALSAAVADVGYEQVSVERTPDGQATVQLANPRAHLDLGAIAKGYIADKAVEALEEGGAVSAVVNFGGNIVCLGEKSEGTPFRIGVEKPFSKEGGEKELLGTLQIADRAVVTSGTYERKFYENGILYYHILDPGTGYPRETDLDGVTIVGPNSTDCDGLSTTCLMLGLSEAKALIESLEDFEAVFVTKDGEVVATDGIALEPVDK